MADLSYPNKAAILQIGALSKFEVPPHEAGWAYGVIERILAHNRKIGNPRLHVNSELDLKPFTDEERAVWKYYKEEVVPIEKWKALVQTWKENIQRHKMPVDQFNPDTNYLPNPRDNGAYNPPPGISVYNGGSGGGRDLVVTTGALKHFRNMVALVAPQGTNGTIWQTINRLRALDLKPGTFGHAVKLRGIVQGASSGNSTLPGLVGDTADFMRRVHEALFHVQGSIDALIKEYDTAEEWNGMTTEQLRQVFGAAWGDIGGLQEYGSTDSRNPGGSNGGNGGGNNGGGNNR